MIHSACPSIELLNTTSDDTTLEAYVQSNVFDPLGVSHSTIAKLSPDDQPGNRAAPHVRDDASFSVAEDMYLNMHPAGSLLGRQQIWLHFRHHH
ncbi:hypothetical protein [Salinibaculum salinum]|uniref:hypothetical protein n=1 Tax=Salinibaculum salinum TaxID=3131996 RepID=UPI0030ECCA0D